MLSTLTLNLHGANERKKDITRERERDEEVKTQAIEREKKRKEAAKWKLNKVRKSFVKRQQMDD